MKTKKKKYNSIFVSNKDCGITDWLPKTNAVYENIESNSWFDIKHFKNPDAEKIIKYNTIAPIIPSETKKNQQRAINKLKKKNPNCTKIPVFICSKKIRLYPTDEQKLILDKWFELFADMYNATTDYIRKNIIKDDNFDPIEVRGLLNFIEIRRELYEKKHNIQKSIDFNQISIHILDEAIKTSVSNHKTCITNFIKGHIKKFYVKEWAHNRKQKIIKIEKLFFTKGTFCSGTFPEIESSESLNNVRGTSTLQFDTLSNKYILFVPQYIKPHRERKIKLSCGGDIGERSFLTVYSENDVYSFCNDIRKNKYIKNYVKKMDHIKKLLKLKPGKRNVVFQSRVKRNNMMEQITIHKKIKRSSLKRGLRKYQKKIEDKVKDMHYKVSHLLVHKYDNIYLGKFNIRGVLSKNNPLPKTIKNSLKRLSPGKFWKILEYMGYKYATKTRRVSEYLTTMTCSCCGNIQKMKTEKVYKCSSCKKRIGRDENSAKNHLKLGLESENLFLAKPVKKKLVKKNKKTITQKKNYTSTKNPKKIKREYVEV